jgi:hypothetical protein
VWVTSHWRTNFEESSHRFLRVRLGDVAEVGGAFVADGGFLPVAVACNERQVWGMKSGSCR